jgi:hypothetical protein
MSRYSIAQRTPLINSMFAGLACAIALTLTAGPALAQSADMGRVEIRGRVVEAPVRYDVRESCQDIEGQLQGPLEKTMLREARYGQVKVEFVMENGQITAVKSLGMPGTVTRDVRAAVRNLECGPQSTASAQIYRFAIEFVDPYSPEANSLNTRTASAGNGALQVRVAQVSR